MSTIEGKMTVGELVAHRPSRSRVFEDYGIDYCCGGQQTLEAASAAKGISLQELIEAIERCDAENAHKEEKDWSEASITELTDHILDTHHAFMKREVPRVSALVEKVAEVHGENHRELADVRRVFQGLRMEIEAHLMKEEQVLFPFAKQLDASETVPAFHCGSLQNPIRMMIYEHENAGEALERLRELTNDYTLPEDGCNTYRAMLEGLEAIERDLHWHIHKENNILFPNIVRTEQAKLG